MSKRIAVMDLGTNTFHLLIAEGTASDYQALVHKHEFVKLGEGGINHGIIQPAPFERGLATMQSFKELINEYQVEDVRAIATSALRNASNGQQFVDKVADTIGIHIEVITGEQEAVFIYKGVKLAGSVSNDTTLIMDIGGGSVEYILGNEQGIIWKQSFEIGAARLMDKFHQTDPIPAESIKALNGYLDEKLTNLLDIADKYQVSTLIGSSGAFETFAELTLQENNQHFDMSLKSFNFEVNHLMALLEKLIASSREERKKNEGIIPVRVDMIVVASLITRFVINRLKIQQVGMSTYSLKEGVLAEMMNY